MSGDHAILESKEIYIVVYNAINESRILVVVLLYEKLSSDIHLVLRGNIRDIHYSHYSSFTDVLYLLIMIVKRLQTAWNQNRRRVTQRLVWFQTVCHSANMSS